MCREMNSFPNLQGGNSNYDPWEIYNFPPPPEPLPIENLPEPVQQPQPQPQPQDELVEENHDDFFPLQNEDLNEFIAPEPIEEQPQPVFHHLFNDDDGAGQQAPNEDPDDTIASAPQSQPNSLSDLEDYESIDRRIKVLNISLFILETVNIIFNQIHYQEDRPN